MNRMLYVQCSACSEPLTRITQSEANDMVICPNCLAGGSYKEVIEQSAGLMKVTIDKELVDLIKKQWVALKFNGN